jgi:IMP dehydrogenase/GMP reductase
MCCWCRVLPGPAQGHLATQFTRNIRLNLPLVSAAMDTVTEARLAIAIAQEGGIGIVHKNLTAAEQAARWPRSSATSPACCATRWSSRPSTRCCR